AAHCTQSTGPTGPAVAEQQPAGPACTSRRECPTGTTDATVTDESGRSAGTAGNPGACAVVVAVAPVAVEQTPGTSVGGRCGAVSAVADQRAAEQRLAGQVDHVKQLLQR
ncbi:hypothetical protein NJB1728e24_22680, partial [Mycobacterium marinum]